MNMPENDDIWAQHQYHDKYHSALAICLCKLFTLPVLQSSLHFDQAQWENSLATKEQVSTWMGNVVVLIWDCMASTQSVPFQSVPYQSVSLSFGPPVGGRLVSQK